MMRPTEDDTSIRGQILGAAARAVGAIKAATFEVYRQGADTYAIELRVFRAYDGSDPLTAQVTPRRRSRGRGDNNSLGLTKS